MNRYFVRLGVVGQVGRFVPVEAWSFTRGMRVVCRTSRGLEVGEVLGRTDEPAVHGVDADGQLLRRVTIEDDLLLARLARRKNEAFDACRSLLDEHGLDAVLLDVEPTFDGQSLYFYFLGDVSAAVTAITDQLAEAYESQARLGSFAATLAAGCGPDCGTELGGGCGSGGCSTCAVATACGKGRLAPERPS